MGNGSWVKANITGIESTANTGLTISTLHSARNRGVAQGTGWPRQTQAALPRKGGVEQADQGVHGRLRFSWVGGGAQVVGWWAVLPAY